MGMIIHTCVWLYTHTCIVICTYTYSYTHIRAKLRTVVGIYSYTKLNVRALELLNPLTPGVEKKTNIFLDFFSQETWQYAFLSTSTMFYDTFARHVQNQNFESDLWRSLGFSVFIFAFLFLHFLTCIFLLLVVVELQLGLPQIQE